VKIPLRCVFPVCAAESWTLAIRASAIHTARAIR
jgi:hypothetical protein